MTPERWQKIKDVLATVLDLAPDERAGYLAKSCAGDDLLRHDVEVLLQREQKSNADFLSQTSLAETVAVLLPEEENPWIGRRVGAYQIVEQIGIGGMGEVYRAYRADDQYRKEVALKVVRAGQDSGLVLSRFKNERQILAGLEHSNIARLLDGGTIDDGLPYFVMELIEGQTLNEYCNFRKLTTTERLKLFLQVCSAVQYAHQRLIIHRDLKPGNILVTADGMPKLLDFGIAKLLDTDPASQVSEPTMSMVRLLTTSYASPEQIRGEALTTVSDVYSLGVLLYELLSGQHPYRTEGLAPHEVAKAVCEFEPEKPSAIGDSSSEKSHRDLRGDLDNIVLMALRKEPSRRYSSTEHLAADIQRHLDHLPVLARKDTASYRLSKFVGRHKLGVMASAVVAISIVSGLAIALHEAHVARVQAELAREQRQRAERRFNDVRKLANSLMFEIHDSIRDLPGATTARTLLVKRALEYLDSLSHEASGDAALQQELAAAYDRVGDVLGYDGAANKGDFAGAVENYNKALAIRESAAATNPNNVQIQSDLINNYFRLSFALQSTGDYDQALSDLHKAVPVAQKLASGNNDPKFQDWLAGIHWQSGNLLSKKANYAAALEEYRAGTAIREPLALTPNASASLRTHLAADYNGAGHMLWRMRQTEQALDMSKKSARILEELSGASPNNATLREYLGETYSLMQTVLKERGDPDGSMEYGQKAHEIFKKLVAGDPTNSLATDNLGFTGLQIAEVLITRGRITEAQTYIKHAMNLFEGMPNKTRYNLAGQAGSYSALAEAYEALAEHETSLPQKAAQLRQAKAWLQKSVAIWQHDPTHGSPDPMGGREGDLAREELRKCEVALAKLNL
jgi:serine/threonine protein kinase